MLQSIPDEASRAGSEAAVAGVEAWLCSVPLSAPLVLGDVRITARDYVVARITAGDGTTGCAFALARGAPLDLLVTDVLGPALLGAPASVAGVTERVDRALVILGREGLGQRAASIADLCAWDLAGRCAGEPVWRLFAPAAGSRPVPLMLVEGYPVPDERPEAMAERLAARVQDGYRALKLAVHGDMDAVLAATRAAVGPDVALAVDATWRWRSPAPALAAARRWERHTLAWLEDPFPRERIDWLAELRRAVSVPVAYGDETTRPAVYEELIAREAADVARVDATTVGGLSALARLVPRLLAAGLRVAPHVFPEIHRHAACAWPAVGPLELFRPASGFDMAHRLVAPVAVVDGATPVPEAPGLGLEFDWEAVTAHAVRHTAAGAPA